MKVKKSAMPPVVILCGGKGTRLGDITKIIPKPMVKIGKEPILRHIMNGYAAAGCTRFVLCLGYLKDKIIDYFQSDALKKLKWDITLLDTGSETGTGGRVWKAANALGEDDEEFFLTYGDGVANIDHKKVLKKHHATKRAITISGVHPASRFGELIIKGDKVTDFAEKTVSKFYINGGFMVVSREFIGKYLTRSPKMFFEQAPMRNAAAAGDMTIYKHEGFWQCMDTPREFEMLNNLWKSGKAPWKV